MINLLHVSVFLSALLEVLKNTTMAIYVIDVKIRVKIVA